MLIPWRVHALSLFEEGFYLLRTIFSSQPPEAEKDLLNGDGGPTKNLMDTVPYLKPQHTPGKKYPRHSLSPTNDSGILKIINCCLRVWGMFKGYVGEFFGFLFFFDGRANRLHPSVFLDFFFCAVEGQESKDLKIHGFQKEGSHNFWGKEQLIVDFFKARACREDSYLSFVQGTKYLNTWVSHHQWLTRFEADSVPKFGDFWRSAILVDFSEVTD